MECARVSVRALMLVLLSEGCNAYRGFLAVQEATRTRKDIE